MRPELRELASEQHGAFTVRQAMRWYSPRRIRSEVRAGRWLRVHNGVLCEAAPSVPLKPGSLPPG